ncbi:DUF2203 domain-containing protein [Rosettibacter firmus]|uniref:DUF2203 domain-containing protein n=1 Tax=Rosettibacter firmus TaxID=3111522 RepID=UPI00336BF684
METKVKYFTPEEAKKSLPLVKRIVRDILNTAYEIRMITYFNGGKYEGNLQIEILKEKINNYIKELEEIGCTFKDWDFEIGLVDFPSIINGEEVYLCWRSDEDDIKFYHGINEGYTGRKPIPEDYL